MFGMQQKVKFEFDDDKYGDCLMLRIFNSFARHDLSAHMRTHTGEKVHSSVCTFL